jgi:lipid II:glycine glycyltransferase (peptidoglycan interpeptide bridge formation enzyme)
MMPESTLSTFALRMGIRMRHIYFAPDTSVAAVGEDLQIYLQSKSGPQDAKPFMTSVIYLDKSESDLRINLSKTTLYEINRAQKKDGLRIDFLESPTDLEIREFIGFFNVFAKFKGLAQANAGKLVALRDVRALLVGKSSNETAPMAMHAYICDGHRARLLYSASNPSLRSSDQRNLLGRANKLLHWKCIIHFQHAGLKEYDLGGISTLPELESNNAFKKSFGGTEITEFNALVGISNKGKFIAFVLRTLLGR